MSETPKSREYLGYFGIGLLFLVFIALAVMILFGEVIWPNEAKQTRLVPIHDPNTNDTLMVRLPLIVLVDEPATLEVTYEPGLPQPSTSTIEISSTSQDLDLIPTGKTIPEEKISLEVPTDTVQTYHLQLRNGGSIVGLNNVEVPLCIQFHDPGAPCHPDGPAVTLESQGGFIARKVGGSLITLSGLLITLGTILWSAYKFQQGREKSHKEQQAVELIAAQATLAHILELCREGKFADAKQSYTENLAALKKIKGLKSPELEFLINASSENKPNQGGQDEKNQYEAALREWPDETAARLISLFEAQKDDATYLQRLFAFPLEKIASPELRDDFNEIRSKRFEKSLSWPILLKAPLSPDNPFETSNDAEDEKWVFNDRVPSFFDKLALFNTLSLFPSGSLILIYGQKGSGKTTLAKKLTMFPGEAPSDDQRILGIYLDSKYGLDYVWHGFAQQLLRFCKLHPVELFHTTDMQRRLLAQVWVGGLSSRVAQTELEQELHSNEMDLEGVKEDLRNAWIIARKASLSLLLSAVKQERNCLLDADHWPGVLNQAAQALGFSQLRVAWDLKDHDPEHIPLAIYPPAWRAAGITTYVLVDAAHAELPIADYTCKLTWDKAHLAELVKMRFDTYRNLSNNSSLNFEEVISTRELERLIARCENNPGSLMRACADAFDDWKKKNS